MKGLKILLMLALCFTLGLSLASANIAIDETFEDGTPFTDLNFASTTSPTFTQKGINVYHDGDGSAAGTLIYDPTGATSLTLQGAAVRVTSAPTNHAWLLQPGEQFFMGQSGVAHVPSGSGTIGCNGENTTVHQVAVAVQPASAAKAVGTDLGSVALYVTNDGNTSTHTLTYNFVVAAGNVVEVQAVRDGAAPVVEGTFLPNQFTLLTTVFESSESQGYRWETSETAPKIWPDKTELATSTTLTGGYTGAAAYTFVGNEAVLGTPATPAWSVDNPWIYSTETAISKIRTIRYAAGPADQLFLDDMYMDAGDGLHEGGLDGTGLDVFDTVEQNGYLRLHALNTPYAGLPVELSVFEVR